jgi:hypothetical protein
LKHRAVNPHGNQISPSQHLSNTEMIVFQAISSKTKKGSNQNLVEHVIQTTRLSELQVRAAFFLLLQKNVISSGEIIDMEML